MGADYHFLFFRNGELIDSVLVSRGEQMYDSFSENLELFDSISGGLVPYDDLMGMIEAARLELVNAFRAEVTTRETEHELKWEEMEPVPEFDNWKTLAEILNLSELDWDEFEVNYH